MEDSTGIKLFSSELNCSLNVLTHCGIWVTSRDEY